MNFIEQHPEVIYILLTVLLSIVSYLFKRKIETMEADIMGIKKDIQGVKGNYLARFDGIKELMNKQHEELINQLGDIKTAVATQTAVCKLIQDQKKNNITKK